MKGRVRVYPHLPVTLSSLASASVHALSQMYHKNPKHVRKCGTRRRTFCRWLCPSVAAGAALAPPPTVGTTATARRAVGAAVLCSLCMCASSGDGDGETCCRCALQPLCMCAAAAGGDGRCRCAVQPACMWLWELRRCRRRMQPAAETSKDEEDEELHVGSSDSVSCNPFSLASK